MPLTFWCARARLVMFSEVTEVRDVVHLLTARAANQDIARALVRGDGLV